MYIINELFDQVYSYQKKKLIGEGIHKYTFQTKNKDGSDGENMTVRIMHHIHDPKSAHVSFEDETHSFDSNNKHKHDSHKVLGTVKKILKDHAEKHDLHSYTFQADNSKGNGSRASVYTRMARGHKISDTPDYSKNHSRYIEVSTKKVNEELKKEQGKMKNTYGLSKDLIEAVKSVGKESEKILEQRFIDEYEYKLENGYLSEAWKYHQYNSHEEAVSARKAHFAHKNADGTTCGNACRNMGNGKLAYQGEFKGPKPVKKVEEEEQIDELKKSTLISARDKLLDALNLEIILPEPQPEMTGLIQDFARQIK